MMDMDGDMLAAWWKAPVGRGYDTNGSRTLAGVKMSDDIRAIVESRPPDRMRDDVAAPILGKPYLVERTYHRLFSSWTETHQVQPVQHRRYFIWDGPQQIALPIEVQDEPWEDPNPRMAIVSGA